MSRANPTIATATLQWEGRTLALTYETDWLNNDGIDHLEIECVEPPRGPLPLSGTGYLSVFIDAADGDDRPGADYVAYVRLWLDEAASGKDWRAYIEAKRQLCLFD